MIQLALALTPEISGGNASTSRRVPCPNGIRPHSSESLSPAGSASAFGFFRFGFACR